MLNEIEQQKKLLTESRNILIVFGENYPEDSVAAALALNDYLIKQGKKCDIVSPYFLDAKKLKFLPGWENIKGELSGLKKFIIRVNVANTKIKNLSYDVKDGWLSLHLTPETGALTKEDVRTAETDYKYDLVILFNTPDLEALGDLFFNNTELFYHIPTINIDASADNEHYGKINLVEITATSSSEILFKMLENIDDGHIDEKIATALLAGMISRTQSFKTKNVTPKTLKSAGRLLNLGADREKIIRNLYQTKTIAGLKLWGETISRLNHEHDTGLIWAIITRQDFIKTGATLNDIKELTKEIIENTPEAQAVLLIYENPNEDDRKINGILYTKKNLDAARLARQFNPLGNQTAVKFSLTEISNTEIKKTIVEEINQKIKNIIKNIE